METQVTNAVMHIQYVHSFISAIFLFHILPCIPRSINISKQGDHKLLKSGPNK